MHPLKLQLTFMSAHGLNFWSGLDDILDGITSSNDPHLGVNSWRQRFFLVKVDINRSWISATNQAVWLSLSDPQKLLNVRTTHPSVKLRLIITNKPNAKLHS